MGRNGRWHRVVLQGCTSTGQAAVGEDPVLRPALPRAAPLRCSSPAVPAPFPLGGHGGSQRLTGRRGRHGSLSRDACLTLSPFAAPPHPSPGAGHPLPASRLRTCQLWRCTPADSPSAVLSSLVLTEHRVFGLPRVAAGVSASCPPGATGPCGRTKLYSPVGEHLGCFHRQLL